MKIYVDADACPVKDIIINEAKQFQIPVVLVKSFAHFSSDADPSGVTSVYVDTGADAADYRIMQLAHKNDLIVTQDYGLASLGLGKGCIVVHHKGFLYSQKNIDELLTTRYESAKARKAGKRTKGPKPFTNHDREHFRTLLVNLLNKYK